MSLLHVAVIVSLSFAVVRPAFAQLEPAGLVGPVNRSEAQASESTTSAIDAQVAENYRAARASADAAIQADAADSWGYYVQADALLAMREFDQALTAFVAAERRCPDADSWCKSVAIWGQANALSEARRCSEATAAYERYASFVQGLDRAAAAMGRDYSKNHCLSPLPPAPFAQLDPAWEAYRRGDSFLEQRRFDEAVAAYGEAETRLPSTDVWAVSVAIWGQANALKEAGRCAEAPPIYERYARFVESRDPEAAAMGRAYAKKTCVPIRVAVPTTTSRP